MELMQARTKSRKRFGKLRPKRVIGRVVKIEEELHGRKSKD